MKATKTIFALISLTIATPLFAQVTREVAEFPDFNPNIEEGVPLTTTAPITTGVRATWLDVFSTPGVVPLTIKAGLMNSSWRLFKASNADWNDATANLYAGGSSAYFTQGLSLTMGNETFLVAYRAARSNIDLNNYYASAVRGNSPKPPAFTRDTTLFLSLLNTRTMGNLNEIRLFDTTTFQSVAAVDAANKTELIEASVKKLRILSTGVIQYAQEHDEKLPPLQNMEVFKKAIFPYVRDNAVFVQPFAKKHYVTNGAMTNKGYANIQFASQIALLYEAQIGSDGKRAVAFADGHVKRVSEAEWTKIKKVSKIK